jgi:hypothetical protein
MGPCTPCVGRCAGRASLGASATAAVAEIAQPNHALIVADPVSLRASLVCWTLCQTLNRKPTVEATARQWPKSFAEQCLAPEGAFVANRSSNRKPTEKLMR